MASVSYPNAVIDTCIPGVLMSITIPFGDIEACRGTNSVVDVNFKSLFKRLNGKSLKALTSESQRSSSSTPASTDNDRSASMDVVEQPIVSSPIVSKPKHKKTDNIIDKLVRKYYCQDSMLSDDDNESGSSSDNESGSDVDSTSEAEKTGSASDSGMASSGPKPKKKTAYVDDYYDMDDPFIDDSEAVQEIETKLKSRRVKTKKDGFFVSVGKLQVEEIPVDEDSNLGLALESDFSGRRRHGRDDGGSRHRWKPNEEVTQQLIQLKEWFVNSKIKLFKSSQIPYSLDEPLHKLNGIVLKHHPTALESNPSAYVEVVHEVLGSEIALGKVRGALVRLAAKDKAAEKRALLNQLITKLCNDLKPLVVVCPESMQPAYKAKMAAAAAAAAAKAPQVGEDGAPLEHQLSQEDMEVPISQADGKSSAEHVIYAWYCRWNVPTRSLLLTVLQTTSEWVKLENAYREKLTQHNMRVLTEEECEFLEEKDEITTVLQRISSFLPTSCYYGDVAGIRRAIAHEKNRLRNLQKKEHRQSEDGTSSLPVVSDVSGETSSLPASPVKRSLNNDGNSAATKKPRTSTDAVDLVSQSQSEPVGGSSDANKQKRVRTPKVKAQWEVTPDIQHGLDQFKIIFQATGVKLTKSAFIPHDLESPLHLLNSVVLTINPAALHIAGYVEAVHEIMGGEIPAGRVKALLLRLVAKEKAAVKKEELNGMIDKLCGDLKPLVVACPESMQPAYKAKMAAAASSGSNNSSNIGGDTLESSLDMIETSRMSFDGLSNAMSADHGDGVSRSGAPSAPEYAHFMWYCKWNVPTRSQLMSIVQVTGDWVKLENSHREKLTSHNMRIMAENEYCILEEKDEITSVFQRIASSFPESCLNGDVASIRRAVASEKGRLKKLQQKEQKAVEAGVTPWVSSGAASMTGSSSGSSSSLAVHTSHTSSSSGSLTKKPTVGSSSSSSGAAKAAGVAGGSASSIGGTGVTSPVKKSLQELSKAAKAPVAAPIVSETPKILIANPQKVEINGRVYAAKMLAVPGLSEPAKREPAPVTKPVVEVSENAAVVSKAESLPVRASNKESSDAAASDPYWDAVELTNIETSTAAYIQAHSKRNSQGSGSGSSGSSSSSNSSSTIYISAAASVPVDESTESFMLKYLL